MGAKQEHYIDVDQALERLFDRNYDAKRYAFFSGVPTLENLKAQQPAKLTEALIIAEVMAHGTAKDRKDIEKQYEPEEINAAVQFAEKTLSDKAAGVNKSKVHHITDENLDSLLTLGAEEDEDNLNFNERSDSDNASNNTSGLAP